MRVSIVGAGIVGLSLAWALAKRGAEVALFEHGGIRHRPLSQAALAKAVPMIRAAGVVEAFEAEGAGELFVARIVTSLAAWLKEAGVALHPRTRVREVDPQSGRLVTDRGVFDVDVVVVAAGAWVRDLVPAAAARLTPSRQTVLYLKSPERLAAAWRATTIIVDTGLWHGAYVLPPREGMRPKIGDHVFTRHGHGGDDRFASAGDVAPVEAPARESLVDFDDYRLLEAKVCCYTVTADERFVVEPIGPAGWLLSACSGHGCKLAPLIATRLADALVGRIGAGAVTAFAAGLPDIPAPA